MHIIFAFGCFHSSPLISSDGMPVLCHHRCALLIVLVIMYWLTGAVVMLMVEKWSFLHSSYFAVATMLAIGYGDFYPTLPSTKIFTAFYVFAGITLTTMAAAISLSQDLAWMYEDFCDEIEFHERRRPLINAAVPAAVADRNEGAPGLPRRGIYTSAGCAAMFQALPTGVQRMGLGGHINVLFLHFDFPLHWNTILELC